jgi:hypothetical protein
MRLDRVICLKLSQKTSYRRTFFVVQIGPQ